LLKVRNHVQHRVHVIRRRRHRKTGQRPGTAVNQAVFQWQLQVQSLEVKGNWRCQIFVRLHKTRVESSNARERASHLLPELLPHRVVHGLHEPGDHRARINYGSGSGIRVKLEILAGERHQHAPHADSGEVHVVKRGPVGVAQKRGGPDALGLAHGPEFERPGEVVRFEAGKAVREYTGVVCPGLGEKRQWAAAQTQKPLGWN